MTENDIRVREIALNAATNTCFSDGVEISLDRAEVFRKFLSGNDGEKRETALNYALRSPVADNAAGIVSLAEKYFAFLTGE